MFRLKLLDDFFKIIATAVAAIIAGYVLCEYLLKPLWHVLAKNV